MKTKILLAILISLGTFNLLTSQTKNQNLNIQLQLLRKFFLQKNYEEFANFIYPEVIKISGGKAKMIQMTKSSIAKMENDGFYFSDLKFKDPSNFIKRNNETQFTITQEIIMKTPKGKMLAEYTMIGISVDNGKNWKFIDTSGKSKEMMIKYFPNLSKDLIIKPKTQKFIK
ncbi:hypothetical protein [Chryseobacterium daeguense]|uniref:hypothetical protein n=1 Tax=Chryseobacterium daeguense TaxID=412438 RepID=UPI000409BB0E|nr:hypothetical protein [Chryseobacterium daeguense]